jgi:hypothetical protein
MQELPFPRMYAKASMNAPGLLPSRKHEGMFWMQSVAVLLEAPMG